MTLPNLVWKYSNEEYKHWQECTNDGCKYKTEKEQHVDEANGDCTKNRLCECGYTIYASGTHSYGNSPSSYESDDNFHWRVCQHMGCTVQTNKVAHVFDWTANDCTKDKVCITCGRVVKKATEHSWSKDYVHTTSKHYKTCTNPGCTQHGEEGTHTYTTDKKDCTKGTYCSVCGYVKISGSPHHNYSGVPWLTDAGDPSRHYRECANGDCEAREYGTHYGGEAACSTQAQCEGCHALYGELNKENHTGPFETNRGYKAPTLMEKGYSGDKYCEACKTVVEKGHDLPALSEDHKHTYGEQQFNDVESWYECTICGIHDTVVPHKLSSYKYDDGLGHYQQCDSCKYKTTLQPHYASAEEYDNNCTTAVNCDECGYVMVKGYEDHKFSGKYGYNETEHWQVCSNPDCGAVSSSEGHIVSEDNDCTTPVQCSVCGHTLKEAEKAHNWSPVWKSDVNGHYRKCMNEGCEAVDRQAHTPVEDDHLCTTPVICSVCSFEIEPGKETHVFGGDYFSDETGHWRKCQNANCSETEGAALHDGTATCAAKAVCTICGKEHGEKDPDNHTGRTEIKNHVNPTDIERGYTGDICCLDCGVVLERGDVIPPIPVGHVHTYDVQFSDAHHWKRCECGTWIDPVAHELEWAKDETGHYRKCADAECEYREKKAEEHIFGKWITDGDSHWYECEICGYEKDKGFHDLQWVKDENGHHQECLICTYTEEVSAHRYTGYEQPKNDPGTGHYQVCADCRYTTPIADHDHAWTSDEIQHYEKCSTCGYETEKQEHVIGAWEHDDDSHWHLCSICGRILDQEKHTFEGRWCTVCNALDVNFVLDADISTDESVTSQEQADETLHETLQDIISEDSELSGKILEAVDGGKDIHVELTVSDEGITDNRKQLDITIRVYADGDLLGSITETVDPITFTFPLEGLSGRIFRVYSIHGGLGSTIPSWVEGGEIHFASSQFSDFFIEGSNDIVYADVSPIPDQTYTGSEIRPAVKVTINGSETLAEGTDYTVSYRNNIEAGTATVIITGLGDFAGTTKEVTFRIVKPVVIEPEKVSGTDGAGGNSGKEIPSSSPVKTGDENSPALWAVTMLLSLSVFVYISVIRRRQYGR